MFLRPTLLRLPPYDYNIIRTISLQASTLGTSSRIEDPSSKWMPIYNFPHIKLFAGLNKLKIFQAAATAAGVPVLMGLEVSKMVPVHTAELFGVVGITVTISLSIYSLFSMNTIGFVYVNPVLSQIRFSYIDFWGKRKNQDLTLDELVPSGDKKLFDIYTIVRTKTAAGSFKLLKYGNILDRDMFHMIFGDT